MSSPQVDSRKMYSKLQAGFVNLYSYFMRLAPRLIKTGMTGAVVFCRGGSMCPPACNFVSIGTTGGARPLPHSYKFRRDEKILFSATKMTDYYQTPLQSCKQRYHLIRYASPRTAWERVENFPSVSITNPHIQNK